MNTGRKTEWQPGRDQLIRDIETAFADVERGNGLTLHEAAAELEMAREHWKPALDALQRALTLSPSNATVHFKMSGVYGELKDPAKSTEHLETALSLNRGEFSPELHRQSQKQVAFLTAFSETQSGDPTARGSLQSRAEAGDASAQLALAKACFDAQPPRIEEAMRLAFESRRGRRGSRSV